MAKRFFETTIWTQNKWFRKLKPTTKLFWFYLIGSCDNVGVWEEDWDLASFIIGEPLDPGEIYKDLNGKLRPMSSKKMWIVDFCDFQYKELNEQTADNPRKSYIALLKKHGLWQEYLNPLPGAHSFLQAPKDKEQEEEED